MKNNEASTFVFLASIIIGILISMNISFDRENKKIFLSAKQYQDAYVERNRLLSDLGNLQEQYKKYSAKVDKYENVYKNRTKMIGEIQKEIELNNQIIGKSEMHGPGIKIVMKDASNEFMNSQYEYYNATLIHNTDMIQVVNDLINAGAEAIAINGYRVIDTTSVQCNWAFLNVNGIKIPGPFYIDAIGNKETMKNYMLENDNYLKTLMLYGIEVDIDEVDDVKIPAYNGEIKHDYIKQAK